MAASGVYKEVAFRKQPMDVWYDLSCLLSCHSPESSLTRHAVSDTLIFFRYLSQWVAIYQFLLSFVFVPLLVVPFIGGTETGMSWAEMWDSFRDGALCWVQQLPQCSGDEYRGQTWLLPLYTLVNMCV